MEINFADITKSIMAAYRLTEQQLADRIGTTQPTVHRIKSGDSRQPRFDLAMRLISLYENRPVDSDEAAA